MTRRRDTVLVAGPEFRPWDLGTYVAAELKSLHVRHATFAYREAADLGVVQEALVRAVHDSGATVVIGLKLDGVPPDAIAAVRRSGVRVLLWQVDCFTDRVPRWIAPLVNVVDVVAVTAAGMVPSYQRTGNTNVHWIMEGAHLPAFPAVKLTRGEQQLFGSDVAFVGGINQPPVKNRVLADRRMRLFAQVAREFDFNVWGPQRPAVIRRAPSLGINLRRWPAYNADVVRICRASKIVLGVNTINTVWQYFSNRTFLTLASGGFHLTHYVPGLEQMFDNHRHLAWFHDDDECVEMCRYYLRRPAARKRIAAAGQRRVRSRWSMTTQVARLLDVMEVHHRA